MGNRINQVAFGSPGDTGAAGLHVPTAPGKFMSVELQGALL